LKGGRGISSGERLYGEMENGREISPGKLYGKW
jgi:hypothetical protein